MQISNIEYNEVFDYTERKLKDHFQSNDEFLRKYTYLNNYYQQKFLNIVKDNDKDQFFEMLFQANKSQFFNGYFLFRELISHTDSIFEDEWFKQPEGYILQDLPQILKNAIGDNFEQVITTNVMHELNTWAITKYESIYDELNQFAFDIVCYGAFQAILDERDKRRVQLNEDSPKGYLYELNDFSYVTPQHFLTCKIKTQDTEKWELHYWSTITTNDTKAGEIIITEVNTLNNHQFILNVYLKNKIDENERKLILERVIVTLIEENELKREDIVVNLAVVEEFYISVHS